MDEVSEYLLSITAAVIVCAVVKYMIGDNTPMAKIVKVISGVFLAVTILSPLVDFRIDEHIFRAEELMTEGDRHVDDGKQMAETAMADIIKEQMEAYILDEAHRLSVDLSAEVTLCTDGTFLPEQVVITGAVSPYQKKVLSEFMEQSLGIAEGNQRWT